MMVKSAANEIMTIAGIVNGTTNYILTTMERQGSSFEDVLADAQAHGYAEADPRADVDGHDAAAKLAIMASLAFHMHIKPEHISTEGIRRVSLTDIKYAHEMGYAIKLLAIARRTDKGVDIRVHPTMIPSAHPLSRVQDLCNKRRNLTGLLDRAHHLRIC